MEQILRASPQRFITAIDRSGILSTALGSGLGGSRKQRLDHLVAQDHEGGQSPQALRERLVTPGAAEALNDLFAAKFFQIVAGLDRANDSC